MPHTPIRCGSTSSQRSRNVLVVADLRPRVEMLPVIAVTDSEVPVVEDHRVHASLREALLIFYLT
jgi:hypothetical protein